MTSTGEQTPSRLPDLPASSGDPIQLTGPEGPLPSDGVGPAGGDGLSIYPDRHPSQPYASTGSYDPAPDPQHQPQSQPQPQAQPQPQQAAGHDDPSVTATPALGGYPAADGYPAAGGYASPGYPDHDPLAGYGTRRARSGGSRRTLRIGGLVAGTVLVLGVGGALVVPRLLNSSDEPGPTGVTPSVTSVPGPVGATAELAKGRVVGPAITPELTHVVTNEPKLTWAPPKLEAPTTVTVTPDRPNLQLEANRDYTVVLPKKDVVLKRGVSITGGHNVVIIGGIIHVPNQSDVPEPDRRRGMYLKGQTGTVHIEGVRMMGDLSDGFNLDEREGPVVQIQNVQIDLVHGSHDAHHADVIQTWAGPRVLRVDGLRAATQYQGFFLLPNQHAVEHRAPESFTFKRTVLSMMPKSAYAIWLPDRNPSWLDFSGITARLGGGMGVNKLSWPNSSLGLRVVDADAAVDVPAGTPGGSYVSPGYTQKPGY